MTIAELDVTFDERHVLDPARAHARESLVWCLALPEHELGAFAYTWVDGHGRAGAAGVVFGPGAGEPVFELVDAIAVPGDMGFGRWEVGPIRTAHTEPLRRCEVAYAGQAVSMDFRFEGLHEPYAYASHPDGFPAYFADERYEQGGRAQGTLTIRGEQLAFDGLCQRDHSWGARDWGAVGHYKWLNLFNAGSAINVMDLQGYGHSTVRGYVARDGRTAEIVAADFAYGFDDEFFHRDLELELRDSAGRTTTARILSHAAGLQYPINPRLTLIDVVGAAEIEGAPAVSYAEMAWPPDYLADRRGSGAA